MAIPVPKRLGGTFGAAWARFPRGPSFVGRVNGFSIPGIRTDAASEADMELGGTAVPRGLGSQLHDLETGVPGRREWV